MAYGDSSVKARLCQRETVHALLGLSGQLPAALQLQLLRCVWRVSIDQGVQQSLEEAGAIPYLVAQLSRQKVGMASSVGAAHVFLFFLSFFLPGPLVH